MAAYWPDLHSQRLLGTPAPFRRPRLTADERDARDHEAWLERLDRTADAIGVSPAPVRVPVLDLITDLLVDIVHLADELGLVLMCPVLPPPSTGLADARPWLVYALARLAEPAVTHELALWAYVRTRAMVATIARALALVYDGQALDVVCPWCRGVTPETPAGGGTTWRVRDLLSRHDCVHGEPDRRFCHQCPQQIAIVCENACEPPSKDVGTWWRGCPCWPLYEWDWLAKRVRDRSERREPA
ncbi:hypothetical protein [Nonomuraea ceibae]|uniref:hypothetical protein n=1 Tax=Nonomuraea ceibae TaxID=1935170 RepID=UPI001C5FD931|nr:hypothetical protein [Nonomuraea ceibae]